MGTIKGEYHLPLPNTILDLTFLHYDFSPSFLSFAFLSLSVSVCLSDSVSFSLSLSLLQHRQNNKESN